MGKIPWTVDDFDYTDIDEEGQEITKKSKLHIFIPDEPDNYLEDPEDEGVNNESVCGFYLAEEDNPPVSWNQMDIQRFDDNKLIDLETKRLLCSKCLSNFMKDRSIYE